jgi:hypothetical protein
VRLEARSKREFRVVSLADGHQAVLRTDQPSDDMKFLQIHTD